MRSSDLEGGRQLRWLTASKRRCLNHLCDLTSANDKYRNGYIRRSPGSPAIDGSFPAVDGSEAGNTLKSQWNENREEAIAGIKKAWRKHQLQKYSSLGKCISKQFQAMPSDLQKSQCSAAPVLEVGGVYARNCVEEGMVIGTAYARRAPHAAYPLFGTRGGLARGSGAGVSGSGAGCWQSVRGAGRRVAP